MDIWLFVLGYIIQWTAGSLLLYKIYMQRSIYGLSVDTQIAFAIANVSRCIWTLETRLIESNFAYLELAGSTVTSFALWFLCQKYKHTTTLHAPEHFRVYSLAAVALVLAFFFHPSDNWISMQILVAFTMYLEALALVPQLWLMKKMHDVEPITSHYVGLLIVSRVVRMVFWGVLFFLGEHFLQLFIADILHTCFAGDYLYLWVRKLKSGGRLIYQI